jgi:hypothetical protein
MKHPAGPFTVIVRAYRLSPYVDVRDRVAVFHSRHRSPTAAARRLASIINEKIPLAKDVRRALPRGYAGRYLITDGSGEEFALNPFRAKYCA